MSGNPFSDWTQIQPSWGWKLLLIKGSLSDKLFTPKLTLFLSKPTEDDKIPSSAAEEKTFIDDLQKHFVAEGIHGTSLGWKAIAPPEIPAFA